MTKTSDQELEKQNKQILANSAKTFKDEQKLSNLESIGKDWNDEDERILEQIKFAVLNLPSYREDTRQRCLIWLEKLGQVKKAEISQHENAMSKENSNSSTNAEWSEEDEEFLDDVIGSLRAFVRNGGDGAKEYTEEEITWLKSLKERVQSKQEWSKEDEEEFMSLIGYMSYNGMYDSIHFLRRKLNK